MSTSHRIPAIAMLAVAALPLGGCTMTFPILASLPGDTRTVRPGDNLRQDTDVVVLLRDRREIRGRFLHWTERPGPLEPENREAFSRAPKTDPTHAFRPAPTVKELSVLTAYGPVTIDAREIERVTTRRKSRVGAAIFAGAAVDIAILAAAAIALSNADFGMGGGSWSWSY